MGKQVHWDDIPDAKTPPVAGNFLFTVDNLEAVLTDATRGVPRLMYKASVSIVNPAEYAGTTINDYFTVGTNDDPQANAPATWKNSIGAKRLKELFTATMIPVTPDVDVNVEACKGQKFIGTLIEEIDDGKRDPSYAGRKRVKMYRMYRPGSRPVTGAAPVARIAGASDATDTMPPTVAPPPPRPAARVEAPPTVPCPFCGEVMLRSAYGAHAKDKHPDEA